jgi:hypothetical protein
LIFFRIRIKTDMIIINKPGDGEHEYDG